MEEKAISKEVAERPLRFEDIENKAENLLKTIMGLKEEFETNINYIEYGVDMPSQAEFEGEKANTYNNRFSILNEKIEKMFHTIEELRSKNLQLREFFKKTDKGD